MLKFAPNLKTVVMLKPSKRELPAKEGVTVLTWDKFLATAGDEELKEVSQKLNTAFI